MGTRWLSRYQRALLERPFRTNVASGAAVMLMGDAIAQSVELREKGGMGGYDPARAAVMASWSAVGDVPINLMLFSLINRALQPLGISQVASFPQSLVKGVCFFVPGVIVRMPCFIFYVTSCEHVIRNVQERRALTYDWVECIGTISDKLNANLLTIFDRGAQLWIPVNTLTYYAVPVLYRPLTLSCVTVGWMGYLSYLQHKEEERDDDIKRR